MDITQAIWKLFSFISMILGISAVSVNVGVLGNSMLAQAQPSTHPSNNSVTVPGYDAPDSSNSYEYDKELKAKAREDTARDSIKPRKPHGLKTNKGMINEAESGRLKLLTCCDKRGHVYYKFTENLIRQDGQVSADGGQTFLRDSHCLVDQDTHADLLDGDSPDKIYQICLYGLDITKGRVPEGSMYGDR